jgi:dephospho-CoA kinase
MLNIGLTGGIASGKSTVAHMFMELGAHLVDTDQLARQAVEPGSAALAEIVAAFGPGVLDEAGRLNRRGLREVVFADYTVRVRLNAIVHPRVAALAVAKLARLETLYPKGVALMDVPLLFEAGWERRYPVTLVVYVPPEAQMARLIARDQVDQVQARSAVGAQMPLADKRQRAHFVIDNSGGLEDTFIQVWTVWDELFKLVSS